MKKRNRQYVSAKRDKEPSPLNDKTEVFKHTDNKIDQDFPGFPYGFSSEEIITPTTKEGKKIADLNNRDGEKRNKTGKDVNEGFSEGSASAFEATEEVKE